MNLDSFILVVREIMAEFADRTGIVSSLKKPRRYLWTDSFAVCNFLELDHLTGDHQYRQLALSLVGQVHDILGRHRDGDLSADCRPRWISDLEEEAGRKHPTIGGLRIGKELNERRPDEPFDEHLEWDRDGQYYHYLTKWMHALSRVSLASGDPIYSRWAIELAKTAHAKFTYFPSSGGQKRMYWKMSVDLSYPLVSSMGHYDPLDGFITYMQLQAAAAKDLGKSSQHELGAEIVDIARICEGKNWDTEDPLGLGELLSSAFRLSQLIIRGHHEQKGLVNDLLEAAAVGLESFMTSDPLNLPADYRLAFRELGLSIGLHAVEKMQGLIGQISEKHYTRGLKRLQRFIPISDIIEKFWLDPVQRSARSWIEHRDINMVMLATSLAPDEYLSL
ncbi:MAG: hypothetical protein ACLPN1_13750 [Dissulfurispiraceae bacterium]